MLVFYQLVVESDLLSFVDPIDKEKSESSIDNLGRHLPNSRVGPNVMDVRYNVVALTNDDTICRPFKNNFVFELHLKLFRPF